MVSKETFVWESTCTSAYKWNISSYNQNVGMG